MLFHSGHIILIPSQPVFALSPWCCVLSKEAVNTDFIVFALARSGLEPTIYRNRDKNAYHDIHVVVSVLYNWSPNCPDLYI